MALFVPKDRRSLFRQFLGGMYDSVVITDPNGHILEINPRTVEYFGREPDEVLDEPISIYIPGLKSDVVGRIRKGLEGDRHVVIDANGVTKDGRKIACEVAVSCIDLLNPGDLIFTIRNVERRRAYLNAFRAKSGAFEIAQSALFACAEDGRILEANAAFCEMFGLSGAADARKHSFADFMSDDPLPAAFAKALSGERAEAHVVADGDGGDRASLEIALAPSWNGRRVAGVVGSILKA